jgi:hypothetical protein
MEHRDEYAPPARMGAHQITYSLVGFEKVWLLKQRDEIRRPLRCCTHGGRHPSSAALRLRVLSSSSAATPVPWLRPEQDPLRTENGVRCARQNPSGEQTFAHSTHSMKRAQLFQQCARCHQQHALEGRVLRICLFFQSPTWTIRSAFSSFLAKGWILAFRKLSPRSLKQINIVNLEIISKKQGMDTARRT